MERMYAIFFFFFNLKTVLHETTDVRTRFWAKPNHLESYSGEFKMEDTMSYP